MNSVAKIIFNLSLWLCYVAAHAQQPVLKMAKSLAKMSAGVVCAHPDAAQIGAEVLSQGGNAIDAAIAMQWALAVCYPIAGNIGGGGFMVVRLAKGDINTLDYREKAPITASADMYLDSSGQIIPDLSLATHLAAGVPGTVAGLFAAHEKYGTYDMSDLMMPAITLAREGFTITESQSKDLNASQAFFAARNSHTTPFQRALPWVAGDRVVQNDLAKTLERIASKGAEGFYGDETGRLIQSEMSRGQGIMTTADLENYQAIWRKPITIDFDNFRIISMPPPSSGGIALGQLLKLWSYFKNDSLTHNSATYIHLLTEIERQVYADRSQHLGDADFYNVPVVTMLDSTYLISRMDSFDAKTATPSTEVQPGAIHDFRERIETTHLSVVDVWGNAVSATTTLNGAYGSGIMVRGAGFFLNNEMDDFSSKPGAPNMFGLVGGEANAIAPQKRMLSSMTPTIVEKEHSLYLVAGSPGGSTIITSVLQTVLNVAHFDFPLDVAIAIPKFHSQWMPDKLFVEADRFEHSVLEKLKEMGHDIEMVPSLGRVDAILVNDDKTMQICGDPRGDDVAAGFKIP